MYIVFDIESTGFDKANDDIIQFSYAAFDDNMQFVRAEELYYYYKGMSWSEEAYEVHKITLEELEKHADEFKQNLVKMYAILQYNYVIGFNSNRFDCPFCKIWLTRMGLPGLEFDDYLDMMLEYKPLTHRAKISLTNLCAFMNLTEDIIKKQMDIFFPTVQNRRPHDSAYDVTATSMLLHIAVQKNLIGYADSDGAAVIEQLDTGELFAQGKPVDPKGLIVFLTNTKQAKVVNLYYINHDSNKYADLSVIPSTVVLDRIRSGYVLPIVLFPDAADTTLYSTVYRGVKFLCRADEMLMLLGDSYRSDKDLPFDTIIKNTFSDRCVKVMDLLSKYPESEIGAQLIQCVKECDELV